MSSRTETYAEGFSLCSSSEISQCTKKAPSFTYRTAKYTARFQFMPRC
jgi:hypothetical protein